MTVLHPRPRFSTRTGMHAGARQRGAATLIIVALLFFVMSLVAAYTNRNLIFEQRTGSNQQRSTMAFEAATAAIEWTLSMLNGGRIDDSCVPSVEVTDPPFRERYLTIDAATGEITPRIGPDGEALWPSCVFDGSAWTCSCPRAGGPALAAPAGTAVFPAFRIVFEPTGRQDGTVELRVNGCTRLDDGCLDFPQGVVGGEGRAQMMNTLALRSSLPALPTAALTVRGDLDTAATTLRLYNTDTAGDGITLITGGTVGAASGLQLYSLPGTPGVESIVESDADLAALADGQRLFATTFSIWPDAWRDQPGLFRLTDCAPCTAADVRAAAAVRPGQPIWVDGDLDLDSGGDVGSAAAPLAVVVTGQVTIDVPFYGVLYTRAADWDTAGSGSVLGAVIVENTLSGTGTFSVVRDAAVLQTLQKTTGSFVRLPGGWRDFE